MPANVIMPALELAQETGKVVHWLKRPGETVRKGEPIVEIETDKVTVEIEAPASGVLRDVTANEGDVVPVGRTIALIVAPGEVGDAAAAAPVMPPASAAATGAIPAPPAAGAPPAGAVKASPLARRIAEQHGVDLGRIRTASGRIEKADVLAYVESQRSSAVGNGQAGRRVAASPKARRLAAERGLDIAALRGSGPGGAVLADDVPAAARPAATPPALSASPRAAAPSIVSRLASWLDQARKQTGAHVTYTDLLVKLVAAALSRHPRVNASWRDGAIAQNTDVNIGLAVAIDDGLVVPVIHRADSLRLPEIAARRADVVSRAQAGKLRPADIQGGGFTISNLGMFGVDAFNAIVNPPQAAILAVGRIADRVVAHAGQPAVRPTMVLTLSCDHRALDGARAAQFLGTLADLVEEPLALLV